MPVNLTSIEPVRKAVTVPAAPRRAFELEPPHRVAFTWHAGTPEAEATRVEVTFTEDGPGRTEVVRKQTPNRTLMLIISGRRQPVPRRLTGTQPDR